MTKKIKCEKEIVVSIRKRVLSNGEIRYRLDNPVNNRFIDDLSEKEFISKIKKGKLKGLGGC